MSEFAEKIESNLVLLGMTAVEDSLQKNVKETIQRLLQADIKVWMITGDKLETAENIGLMAGIVNHDMETFRLSFQNIENENQQDQAKNNCTMREMFSREIDRVMIKLNKVAEDNELREKNHLKIKKIAIVFDMRDVRKSLTSPTSILTNLDFLFADIKGNQQEADQLASLLMKADSVVCARSTPKQKASIVNFVRKRHKICLAIGDGANDVNMIMVSLIYILEA